MKTASAAGADEIAGIVGRSTMRIRDTAAEMPQAHT
jgi:hypothetical protein